MVAQPLVIYGATRREAPPLAPLAAHFYKDQIRPLPVAEKIAIQRLYATTMGGVVGSTAHASVSRDGRGSIAIFRLRHGRYARQALVTRRE